MSKLDNDYILHGSDQKNLITSYHNLINEYTEEGATEYLNLYKDKPLSFILENSRYIFAEPLFGCNFYKSIVESASVDPYSLYEEGKKVDSFMEENAPKMESTQKEVYESMQDTLHRRIDSLRPNIVLEYIHTVDDPTEYRCIKNLYDMTYEMAKTGDYHMTESFQDILTNISDQNVMIHAIVPMEYCFESASKVGKSINSYHKFVSTKGSFKDFAEATLIADMIGGFLNTVTESVSIDNSIAALESFSVNELVEKVTEDYRSKYVESSSFVYTGSQDAVYSLFFEDTMDNLFKEDKTRDLVDALEKRKAIYEACLEYIVSYHELFEESSDENFVEPNILKTIKESVGIHEPLTVLEAEELMMQQTSELEDVIKEYTNDGKPVGVLKRHHDMYGGNPKTNTTNSNVNSNDDDDDEDSSDSNSSQNSSNDEGSGSAEATNMKPVKPKTGVLNKIQNKSLDLHAKSRLGSSKLKQLATNIKNAGKAVLKLPAGLLKGLRNTAKNFEEMDDNKRKEMMLEPGFRKKYFARIRTLLQYGGAMYLAGPIMFPITWIARSMSKEKNKRIRNEFIAELDTEIKVTEEKINDASSRDDKKEKYQLMRIRDKLQIERERVLTNSKYI